MYQERSSAVVDAANELRAEVKKTNDALSHALNIAGIVDEDQQDEEMMEEGDKEVRENLEERGRIDQEERENLEVRGRIDQEGRENLEVRGGIDQEERENLEVRGRIDQEGRNCQELRTNKAKACKKVGGRMINLDPVKCVSTLN